MLFQRAIRTCPKLASSGLNSPSRLSLDSAEVNKLSPRPHQSLNGLPPDPDERIIKARNGELTGKIVTEERLNGLIKIRYREAA